MQKLDKNMLNVKIIMQIHRRGIFLLAVGILINVFLGMEIILCDDFLAQEKPMVPCRGMVLYPTDKVVDYSRCGRADIIVYTGDTFWAQGLHKSGWPGTFSKDSDRRDFLYGRQGYSKTQYGGLDDNGKFIDGVKKYPDSFRGVQKIKIEPYQKTKRDKP